ncbi:DgyrCDS10282 [Dimorphilus gyrociliatus]|uniref:DgyrCDS10282 n=1 Tax=Dimorphilus gyrociliatus TaxID=2664684 RepID=A0A7I8VZY4_9ANNE|nr:DgyrCDS10282 [Dimorphilus gyrociliatus]
MDDNSSNFSSGNEVSYGIDNDQTAAGRQQNDNGYLRPQYSMEGLLNFLESEWARFEMEKSEWEVERAELQARIAFLQGERKGQENLKQDLIRRIKMLEHSLKQERAKVQRLLGSATEASHVQSEDSEISISADSGADNFSSGSWRTGRHILRQYLQDIGYHSDTILNTKTVRSMPKPTIPDNEAAVLDSLELLSNEVNKLGDNLEEKSDRESMTTIDDILSSCHSEDVMKEFDVILSAVDQDQQPVKEEWGVNEKFISNLKEEYRKERRRKKAPPSPRLGRPALNNILNMPVNDIAPSGGEEQITFEEIVPEKVEPSSGDNTAVSSEQEMLNLLESTEDSSTKTWSAKYTLRSHFDAIRSVYFHPNEPILFTGSEDHTLKMWNLKNPIQSKSAGKKSSLEVEAMYTFRNHKTPITKVALSKDAEYLYSGSLDGNIRVWRTPPVSMDPYDNFNPKIAADCLTAHTDAIWGLKCCENVLLSCSADNSIRIWNAEPAAVPLLNTIHTPPELGSPSALDYIKSNKHYMIVCFNKPTTLTALLYNIETGEEIMSLQIPDNFRSRINAVVTHPTSPLAITAHDNKQIRFFDLTSAKTAHVINMAHMDSVTSLDVDSAAINLVSGSHDGTVRIWNVESRQCLHEITAHRKKYDESIFDVAFHPSKAFIASAGADAIAKVFV